MKIIVWSRILLAGLAMCLAGTLLAASAAGQSQAPAAAAEKRDAATNLVNVQGAAGNLRVLFIGNSMTYLNDLPRLTARLAASAKPPRALETEFVGEGGATLRRHWEAGRALEAIRAGNWDYVVLQEQSGTAQIRNHEFQDYARRFDAEIKKAGAKTLLFLSWARLDAPHDLRLVVEEFGSVAAEVKAAVAPIGLAWHHALQENSALRLHYDDGSHPGPAGTYLTACVLYTMLYAASPVGLDRGGLSEADAAFLQRTAWKTFEQHQHALAAGKSLHTDIAVPAAPPAPAAAAPATPEALERGRAILAAAQRAAGGLERLRSLRDVSIASTAEMKVPGQQSAVTIETREFLIFPSVFRHEARLSESGGRLLRLFYFNGDEGWELSPQGLREIAGISKQHWQAELFRNPYNLLRAEGEFTVQYEKREKVGEAEAEVILISKGDESVRLWVASASGLLLKKAYRGMGLGGQADIEQTFSDYREVDGIRTPFRVAITQNGFPFIQAVISEMKFNTGVSPAELAKKPE
jgi:hypothetical protein